MTLNISSTVFRILVHGIYGLGEEIQTGDGHPVVCSDYMKKTAVDAGIVNMQTETSVSKRKQLAP